MIFGYFKRRKSKPLYDALAAQARAPVFYTDYNVPDTLDGRYELLCLLCALVVIRLSEEGGQERKLAQGVFDNLYKNAELSLREIGVGDLAVPKHMRRMMKGFNGRVITLEKSLHASSPLEEIRDHLRRNLYSTCSEVPDESLDKMARYCQFYADQLAQSPVDQLKQGNVPHTDSFEPEDKKEIHASQEKP